MVNNNTENGQICDKCIGYGVELFKYHAAQRLQCIRYYTTFLGIAVGGAFALLSKSDRSSEDLAPYLLVGLCIFSAMTFFFWLIDIRNRVLTQSAESGLKRAEEMFPDSAMRMMTNGGEPSKEKAWHYTGIIPWFFSLILLAVACMVVFCVRSWVGIPCCLALLPVSLLGIGLWREFVFRKG